MKYDQICNRINTILYDLNIIKIYLDYYLHLKKQIFLRVCFFKHLWVSMCFFFYRQADCECLLVQVHLNKLECCVKVHLFQ